MYGYGNGYTGVVNAFGPQYGYGATTGYGYGAATTGGYGGIGAGIIAIAILILIALGVIF